MTLAETKELEALTRILDTMGGTDEWNKAYDRYFELRAKEQEEYRAENIDKLKEFYDEHIANRTWAEIDGDDWSWYSDFHKDVFGYRPKTLNFGE